MSDDFSHNTDKFRQALFFLRFLYLDANIVLGAEEKLMKIDELNNLIKSYMEKEGYSVCSFYTYDEALLHKDDDVHLWLIDIMLDKASGFELFNEINCEDFTPCS